MAFKWISFSSVSSYNQKVMDITGEEGNQENDLGGFILETDAGYILAAKTRWNSLLIPTGRTTFQMMELNDKDMIDIEREFKAIALPILEAKAIEILKVQVFQPKLTEREIDELTTSCVSMLMQLEKDKHVSKEEKDFWFNLQDKLMMCKIRTKP